VSGTRIHLDGDRPGRGRRHLMPMPWSWILVAMGILTASLCFTGIHAAGPAGSGLESLALELEAGRTRERQAPFVQRGFEPVLDGRWIGHAVAYGPHRRGQEPGGLDPSRAELLEDLRILARHWNLIRVYNADGNSLRVLELIREHKLPLRVLLGVWLEDETGKPDCAAANRGNVLRAIEQARAFPEIVLAVSVGNETQVDWAAHRMATGDLVRYIRALRDHVEVPVTTADDYQYWLLPASGTVAAELDFVTTHLHPLWNGRTLEEGLDWMDRILDGVRAVHPGRTLVVGETGWATRHDPESTGPGQQGTLIKGETSERAQGEFLIRLAAWVERDRVATFLFEAFDEPWKGGGERTNPRHVEKHWGVFREDRTPKSSFQAFLAATGAEGSPTGTGPGTTGK
jgi:exo-beta-1,3-glucanase (GH17 family)